MNFQLHKEVDYQYTYKPTRVRANLIYNTDRPIKLKLCI